MNDRKAITKPIIQAAIILAVYLAIEAALVYLNVFSDYNLLLCADILRDHDHDLCDTCIAFAARAAEEIINENKVN